MENNYFAKLNAINVSDKTEEKNGLTYLSWAWAWGELKKAYPDSNYKVYEREDGRIYFDDGRTAWVKVSVTCEGIEHIEYLPIMDNRNNSMNVEQITSFDVNKAIQRALTKAIGRHGLGLYIYAGEDLPEGETKEVKENTKPTPKSVPEQPKTTKNEVLASASQKEYLVSLCSRRGLKASQFVSKFGVEPHDPNLTKSMASQMIEYAQTATPEKEIVVEPEREQEVTTEDDLPF